MKAPTNYKDDPLLKTTFSHLVENHFDRKLVIPGNLEPIEEFKNLVDVNLAVRVGVDQGEQLADEVQGFGLGQPFVGVSVQLRCVLRDISKNIVV